MSKEYTLEDHEKHFNAEEFENSKLDIMIEYLKEIPQHSYDLKCTPEATEKTIQVLKEIKDSKIKFERIKNPNNIISAVQYIGCMLAYEKRTQNEIGEIYDVTQSGLRVHLGKVIENMSTQVLF